MFRSNMYNQQRRRRQQLDPYILLLFFQLWQQVERLPVKPPVTLGLVAGKHAAPLQAAGYRWQLSPSSCSYLCIAVCSQLAHPLPRPAAAGAAPSPLHSSCLPAAIHHHQGKSGSVHFSISSSMLCTCAHACVLLHTMQDMRSLPTVQQQLRHVL